MSDKKICPLRFAYVANTNACIEDKCAWYDKNWHSCALLSLAKTAAALGGS